MNTLDRIRQEIIFQLYAMRPLSATGAQLAKEAQMQGCSVASGEIDREAAFLVGEDLVEIDRMPGTTAPRYKLTSKGVRQYEETNRQS